MKVEPKSFFLGCATSMSMIIRQGLLSGKNKVDISELIETKEYVVKQMAEHGVTEEEYDSFIAESLDSPSTKGD